MTENIKSILINKDSTILEALKKMDSINRKLLIVTDDKSLFCGLLSIGDIQRAIINNLELTTSIKAILREDITVAFDTDDLDKVKVRMKERRNEFMPIINGDKEIVKVLFWSDLFDEVQEKEHLGLPVVIMAGGKGSRLKPLTNVIPKPLIPINEKTIIEDIMDRFVSYGCNEFFLSLNYKADLIKYYFEELNDPIYKISYLQEGKPLGTAGSLSLLKKKLNSTFFVSNCDILVEEDYGLVLEYHRSNKNEITIIAAIKNYAIPYGTLDTTNNGLLVSLVEKPEINFKINSGVYIVEPHLLFEIPENTFFHITQLINKVISRGGRVGVFPVSENAWMDMGSLTEYRFKS
jgi:dTDP-glucose pyrophosphorylase/CBS domain-containing protein